MKMLLNLKEQKGHEKSSVNESKFTLGYRIQQIFSDKKRWKSGINLADDRFF